MAIIECVLPPPIACLSSKTAWSSRPASRLQALAEELLHPPRDVVLLEELAGFLLGPLDHVREVLDLLAHGVVERHGMQFTGVFDCPKHA